MTASIDKIEEQAVTEDRNNFWYFHLSVLHYAIKNKYI